MSTDLHSPSALEYMGLSAIASASIYQRWCQAGDAIQGMDFCGFAEAFIAERALAFSASNDMRQALAILGASKELIDQMMTPGHDDIRNTRSADQWLEEAMEVRWDFLLWRREASEARTNALPSPGAQNRSNVFGASQATKCQAKLGYTVLYRDTTRIRAERIWSEPYRQGTFAIRPLRSKPPGDFSGNTESFSFTTEIEGAQKYTEFCKEWASDAGVCIVAIEVPNEMIEGVDKYILKFPSEEFKKVVWASKQGNGLKSVNKAAHNADLLIGDMTTGVDSKFTGMASANDIEEKHLFKTRRGDRITQYVFDDIFESMINEKCKDLTKVLDDNATEIELQPLKSRSKREVSVIRNNKAT